MPASVTISTRPAPPPCILRHSESVTPEPPAKFFVNQGLVTSKTDMQHLLQPVLKQTVGYRFLRGRDEVATGSGWVERIVADEPGMSSYFTTIGITINVDSFEHLEFETRADQLLVYTLVQGDERVILEFVPGHATDEAATGPVEPRQLALAMDGFVQMELQGLEDPEE
jgi:hypothetical protein